MFGLFNENCVFYLEKKKMFFEECNSIFVTLKDKNTRYKCNRWNHHKFVIDLKWYFSTTMFNYYT